MCNGCLFEWLCPFDITNNNTCPHCRAVCFPKFEPGNTAEGIQARIDLVDWTNEQSQRPSPPFEQEMLDFLRVALVIRREEAMEELEVDRAKVESLLQSKFDSGEGDWTVVLAYRLEMLQFEVRVSTIGAIQAQIWVYKQLQKYRNQLQEMTDALEVIQVGLQEIRNELEIVMEEHRAVPEPEAGGIRAEGFVSEECGELEDGESIETVGDWIRARTDNN